MNGPLILPTDTDPMFWRHVAVNPLTGCWDWQGARTGEEVSFL